MTAMLLFLVFVYLFAAIPFGVVITTLYGGDLDVRLTGSGNIGTTNVARVFGWRIAAPVLGLDVLKGFVAVVAAHVFWPDAGTLWLCIAGLTAFVAHCWPVYLEFHGGKGVATAAGAMLALAPVPTLGAAVLWAALFMFTGKSSIAALGAAAGSLAFFAVLAPQLLGIVSVLAMGVGVRHWTNIGRLVRGEERQVIRPVRWSRGQPLKATAEDVLGQDPGGGSAASPLWRERDDDPLSGVSGQEAEPEAHPVEDDR